MQYKAKRIIAKTIACIMALSVIGVNAPDTEAAKKPKLSKKSISIAVKKSKKITIKNIKAKKVKKLTVKSTKKSIASVKKNGKTAFTVTGKKKGSTKVTVNVKIKGKKKATKFTLKVKVTQSSPKTTTPAASSVPTTPAATSSTNPTASPSGETNRPKPTVRPVNLDNTGSASRPEASPLIDYNETFDDGMGDWFARYDESQGNTASLINTDEAHSGKAMRITGRVGTDGKSHAWNGPALDMSGIGTLGATYELTFWAKLPAEYSDDLAGDEVNLRVSGAYQITDGAEFAYENYPADTDYPINADEWTEYKVTFTSPATFYSYIFYFETNGGGKFDFIIDDLTLKRTVAPAEPDLSLASIKDTYAPYIGIMGTAITYADLLNENTLNFVKHHFNSITMGNSMKPDALMSSKKALKQSEANYIISDDYSTYAANKDDSGNVIVPEFTLDEIDKVLKICHDNGIKIRIHAPMWHQQMPKFFFCEQYDENKPLVTDKNVILAREELFIRNVLQYILTSPYADAVNAYDVVNEYTHMSNESGAVGSENWWKYSFGTEMKTDCEYVKKAFVWAYDVLQLCERTDISLIYNDYNTYEPKTTDQIIDLINNINKVDDVNKIGKICAGVGMQSHLNDESATVENFKTAIEKFAAQGYEIQITELDITNTGKVTGETTVEEKEEVYKANADMYSGIMTAILDAKKAGANISSVTIWGTTDAGSWRSDRAPVLFGTDISDVKPSFHAVIDAALNYGK